MRRRKVTSQLLKHNDNPFTDINNMMMCGGGEAWIESDLVSPSSFEDLELSL